MGSVTSRDGTTIVFDRVGSGQPVILVDGAMCHRAFGPMGALTPLLSPHFTVFSYDRRGRGESGDTSPYTVEREVEDLDALIEEAGGSAFVYGISSGAALALEATIKLGDKIRKLALYEAPYNDDEAARKAHRNYTEQLREVLAEDRRGDAVALFMALVGMPADAIEGMRQAPMWGLLEAVAPTLAYDAAVLGEEAAVPTERAANAAVPALVMAGGAGFPFMQVTAKALANAIPSAQYRVLEGQTHEVAPDAIAPVLIEFFGV